MFIRMLVRVGSLRSEIVAGDGGVCARNTEEGGKMELIAQRWFGSQAV